MVYKYQKETFEYLTQLVEKLENVTESKMSLKIGFIRENYWNGNNWVVKSGDLYLRLNCDTIFRLLNDYSNFHTFTDDFDIVDSESYVKLDDNLFLKLNEWIDKIYENKRKREEFYRKLNLELCALNKAL